MSINVTVSSGNPMHVTRGRVVTSEIEGFKTKEFLKRRRLRLQQVREQSKDIAKSVRERAEKERNNQLGRVEQDKREDYIQRQERLVQRLEQIHASSLQSVGSAHSEAAIINEKDKNTSSTADNSKPRAKLAATELKRNQQKELDKKKQVLDRKLIARNLANARSRLKLSKASVKDTSEKKVSGDATPANAVDVTINANANGSVSFNHRVVPQAEKLPSKTSLQSETTGEPPPSKRDMETQWSVDGLHEWIPSGSHVVGPQNKESNNDLRNFPSDISVPETGQNDCRRKNLFSVSEEMPESLCGSLSKTALPVDVMNKPSLSIVSDFLRTRDHRLQKPVAGFHRVTDHEMQGLRATFKMKSNEGTADICQVVDEAAFPVPSWQPAPKCGFCSFDLVQPKTVPSKINRNVCGVNAKRTRSRSAVISSRCDSHNIHRFSSPLPQFRVPRVPHSSPRADNAASSRRSKSSMSGHSGNSLNRKHSVMHYDHNTKATKDLPLNNEKLVEKVTEPGELDAYSLALKESEEMLAASKNKQHVHVELERSRIAMSRQKVAQEYKDTMTFLQSLSKDSDTRKPIGSFYMDDYHQNAKRISLQRRLRNEFEKVQTDATSQAKLGALRDWSRNKKRSSMSNSSPAHQEYHASPRNLSGNENVTSAAKASLDEAEVLLKHIRNLPTRQISSDGMSIRSDNNLRNNKVGNTVKFDFDPITSYKYTSSVKHTPPTKDRPNSLKKSTNATMEDDTNVNVVNVETENNSDNAVVSDDSSDYDLIVQRHKVNPKSRGSGKSDVRKFIVYKINGSSDEDAISQKIKKKSKLTANKLKVRQKLVQEDVLEGIGDFTKEGNKTKKIIKSSNLEKLQTLETESDVHPQDAAELLKCDEEGPSKNKCRCNEKTQMEKKIESNEKSLEQSKTHDEIIGSKPLNWDVDSAPLDEVQEECEHVRKLVCDQGTQPTASAVTSAATFRTATSDKSSSVSYVASKPTSPIPGGYVKVLDEAGEEAGKFYIGAGKMVAHDPYEVIVQLKRRSEAQKNENKGVQTSSPISFRSKEEKRNCSKNEGAPPQPALITPLREVQFSSSSSTVYMSPPDLIMPKFFKSDFQVTENNVQNFNILKKDELICCDIKGESRGPLSYCNRRSGDNETMKSLNVVDKKTKTTCRKKHLRPKSVDHIQSSSSSPRGSRHSKKKCHCHGGPTKTNVQERQITNKNKNRIRPGARIKQTESNRQDSIHNKMFLACENEMYGTLLKNLKSNSQKPKSTNYKSHLSPRVEKYINQLLAMSKDGLKSVEIAALQCSTVSTPGSSIINVPTNVDVENLSKEHSHFYTNINNMITKNLIKHCVQITQQKELNQEQMGTFAHIDTASSDSQSTEKGIGDIPRLLLKKKQPKYKTTYRHKIKSLNISKNILKYLKTVEREERKKMVYSRKSATRLTLSDTGQNFSGNQRYNDNVKDSQTKSNQKFRKPKLNANNDILGAKINTVLMKRTPSAPIRQAHLNLKEESSPKKQINDENESEVDINNKKVSPISLPKRDDGRNNEMTSPDNSNSSSLHIKPRLNSDNLMHIAEEKLQNMEKIAHLTEKCTKRLSNLARVLDEVRKNKSNMYNQSSTIATVSDNSSRTSANSLKSDAENVTLDNRGEKLNYDKNICINNENNPRKSSDAPDNFDCAAFNLPLDCPKDCEKEKFVPILGDIPKPKSTLIHDSDIPKASELFSLPIPTINNNSGIVTLQNNDFVIKTRSKPPPALSRINLKSEETLMAHELSTVLEVDSPISTHNASSRIKSKSPININACVDNEQEVKLVERNMSSEPTSLPDEVDAKHFIIDNIPPENQQKGYNKADDIKVDSNLTKAYLPDLHNSCLSPLSLRQYETSIHNTENLKIKMMDLNKFNDMMLKPFISIEEYARQYNIALLDEGSNLEDSTVTKKVPFTEEGLSSVNSDETLPDIISELLKRNVISEPFNYDGVSYRDSNTVSSESNNSLLALSKVKQQKKKVTIKRNELDSVDLSDSLSFSSKLDLEKAFEELGIGWASSTLKKTKETLALSSSTSTLSSMEHANFRKHNKYDSNSKILRHLRNIISDTSKTHSATTEYTRVASYFGSRAKNSENKENQYNKSKKPGQQSVELQTSQSFAQPMSVNEFLINSLASKITFSNKSPPREEHFSSLYSTKLTNDKTLEEVAGKQPSCDSTVQHNSSKQNSRQRTSTPVQLFKSLTFNSSTSSYDNSNGIFSNCDDLSSVKGTSVSIRNSSSTDKDELTVPNCSLKMNKRGSKSDGSDTL